MRDWVFNWMFHIRLFSVTFSVHCFGCLHISFALSCHSTMVLQCYIKADKQSICCVFCELYRCLSAYLDGKGVSKCYIPLKFYVFICWVYCWWLLEIYSGRVSCIPLGFEKYINHMDKWFYFEINWIKGFAWELI